MAIKNPPHLVGMMPKTGSLEEERQHRKQQLAGALRVFGKFGFSEGVAGHITARDPELSDHFWVNPFGISFNRMKVSDLILVNEEGKIVEGKHQMLNQAAFAIHSRIHHARPDVIAAAHSHSIYGKTFSALGRLLDPLTQDSCAFFEDHGLYDDYQGVVLDLGEGDAIAEALQDKKAAILKNHGLLTVGNTVEEAAWWFICMERCCQSQLMAEATGTEIFPISAEVARNTRDNELGFPIAGWFNYQPIWQDIVHAHPDLLE
ncbi:MAG: class II aldolase/adducin family protein [Bacteroidia bacterium]|nr:class II aldolase/adducin family protein [Bacteroidia bacterium]